MKIKGLNEVLKAFESGFEVKFTNNKGQALYLYDEYDLRRGIGCGEVSISDLCGEFEVCDKREFHLFFEDNYNEYCSGNWWERSSVPDVLNALYGSSQKPFKLFTPQVILCELKLIEDGFRIFIHPGIGFGDMFEVTLGNCARTSREIKIGMNLPKMIMSGEFGDLYSEM